MKTRMPLPRFGRFGFTILELLVACALSMLVLGILTAVVSNSSRLANSTHSRLTVSREAEMALDYLARDISALIPPRSESSTLAFVPESVTGPGSVSVSSFWMLMLSRPPSQAARGALAGVSYRLLYLDPLVPGGSNRTFALYRSVLSAEETASNLATLSDLHKGYWQTNWSSYLARDSGRTILGDYLAGNIVGIKVTFQYRDMTGKLQRLTPAKQVTWNYLGLSLDGDSAPESALDRQIEGIEITLTMLSVEGCTLLDSGVLPLDVVIQRYGTTVTRLIPFPVRSL